VIFVWDSGKASANLKKHGVDFREAATVFDDPLSTAYPDVDHSTGTPVRHGRRLGPKARVGRCVHRAGRSRPNYQRQACYAA